MVFETECLNDDIWLCVLACVYDLLVLVSVELFILTFVLTSVCLQCCRFVSLLDSTNGSLHQYLVAFTSFHVRVPLDPGNVIIMNDGRLGLIDYGMVGRLTTTDRKLVASTVLAFVSGDKDKVVDNYLSSGYRAGWITAPSSATGAEASSTSSVTITKRRYEHTNHTIYRFAKLRISRRFIFCSFT